MYCIFVGNNFEEMKKQASHRQYNFPDADLYVQCMDRIRFAHRDIEEFKKYGYDLERLKGFNSLCDKFRNLPDDSMLQWGVFLKVEVEIYEKLVISECKVILWNLMVLTI